MSALRVPTLANTAHAPLLPYCCTALSFTMSIPRLHRSFDSMSSVMGGSVDGRGAGSQRDGDGENKSKVFNQFINRQEIKQVQRQKKIEKLKENTAPSFK